MNVLSLDADFFVSPVARWVTYASEERLSEPYVTDEREAIDEFLDRCLLTTSGIRGVFIRHHDEAFDVLRAVAPLGAPIDLVHVDAHADLGLGDVESLASFGRVYRPPTFRHVYCLPMASDSESRAHASRTSMGASTSRRRLSDTPSSSAPRGMPTSLSSR